MKESKLTNEDRRHEIEETKAIQTDKERNKQRKQAIFKETKSKRKTERD